MNWALVWMILTPGGDALQFGIDRFETRTECHKMQEQVGRTPFPMGQRFQSICVEIIEQSSVASKLRLTR